MAQDLVLVRQVELLADAELLDARPQQALRRMLRHHRPQVVVAVLGLPDHLLSPLLVLQALPVWFVECSLDLPLRHS